MYRSMTDTHAINATGTTNIMLAYLARVNQARKNQDYCTASFALLQRNAPAPPDPGCPQNRKTSPQQFHTIRPQNRGTSRFNREGAGVSPS